MSSSSSSFSALLVGLAISTANVVAKGIGTSAHTMSAPAALVPSTATLAAYPVTVQLFETTPPSCTVGRGEAASHGARIVVIDIDRVVKVKVAAGDCGASLVHCRVFAEGIVYYHVYVPRAGIRVVMVKIGIIAHLFQGPGGFGRAEYEERRIVRKGTEESTRTWLAETFVGSVMLVDSTWKNSDWCLPSDGEVLPITDSGCLYRYSSGVGVG